MRGGGSTTVRAGMELPRHVFGFHHESPASSLQECPASSLHTAQLPRPPFPWAEPPLWTFCRLACKMVQNKIILWLIVEGCVSRSFPTAVPLEEGASLLHGAPRERGGGDLAAVLVSQKESLTIPLWGGAGQRSE